MSAATPVHEEPPNHACVYSAIVGPFPDKCGHRRDGTVLVGACGDGFDPDEPAWTCPTCGGLFHVACAQDHRRLP